MKPPAGLTMPTPARSSHRTASAENGAVAEYLTDRRYQYERDRKADADADAVEERCAHRILVGKRSERAMMMQLTTISGIYRPSALSERAQTP